MRRGEALALRWEDVDFEHRLIRVNTTKYAARGRRSKIRYIPMNDVVYETLEGMARLRETVFDPKVQSALLDWFLRVCKAAGVGHVRIHDLRHTFASLLVKRGVPLNTVRELLGHERIDMTLRYAHLAPSAMEDAVQAIAIGGNKPTAKVLAVGDTG